MVNNTFRQPPEEPYTETWRWTTDVQTARDGSEVMIPLNTYPKRVFSGNYAFDTLNDLRYHKSVMFSQLDGRFPFPLWSYAAIVTSNVVGGVSTSITVNAHRTDLRVGLNAFIVQGNTFESAVVDSITATTVTFSAPLVNSYSAGAFVMPLVQGISRANSSVTRRTVDNAASASFEIRQEAAWAPFVGPLNSQTITTFDSLPVLERVPIGSSFEEQLVTGMEFVDSIGLPAIESPWLSPKYVYPLTFLCNKVRSYTDWYYWMKFADTIKGSSQPFLFPTGRQDFELHTAASGADDRLTITNTEYSEHYEGLDAFKRIVITSDEGVHSATVTNVTQSSGRDTIIFSPSTPAGAWATNQKVSLLVEGRLANDEITCEHYSNHTMMGLSIRTVG